MEEVAYPTREFSHSAPEDRLFVLLYIELARYENVCTDGMTFATEHLKEITIFICKNLHIQSWS